jgi:1-acyl-sn-glycerol-3-phosphate acyltransferase
LPTVSRPFHAESRGAIVRRRLVTVPRSVFLFIATTALLPLLIVGGGVVDAIRWVVHRRPWMSLRLIAFGWVFLAAETWGLARFLGHWVLSGFGSRREWLIAKAWPVQTWWARTLLTSVRRLFRLTLRVEDAERARPGPIIAMFRHASIVDNLLPAVLLTHGQGLKLRWIIKRELLSVPALDVGGTRLPNYFVDRDSSDPRTEIRRIRALATDLAEDEGVLIYPEGTRFTEARRKRALAALEERDPELFARARALRHVLPPRIGGPLTLLDSGYDVVMCAHEGLGGFAKIRDIWSGALVGRTINVKFWRFGAAEIPKTRKERIAWLFDQWARMDGWIDATTDGTRSLTPPRASHPPTPS